MAKRKKQPAKIQKRKGAKARPKARKLSNAMGGKAAAKRAVARAKPKRARVKKAARPVAPPIETVAAEGIEQPAPAVTTVAKVEETELRQAS
jgi:CelD/BcsL family acetyltransferase involved in cellulose biosynthesis